MKVEAVERRLVLGVVSAWCGVVSMMSMGLMSHPVLESYMMNIRVLALATSWISSIGWWGFRAIMIDAELDGKQRLAVALLCAVGVIAGAFGGLALM